MVELKVKKLFPDAKIPVRANPSDSGADVFAYKFEKLYKKEFEDGYLREVIIEDFGYQIGIKLQPQERILINTGISISVPYGYETQVRSRSGLSLKSGLIVANSPGTIDSSYRGMVGIILINNSFSTQSIRLGDKIAQLVVKQVELCPIVEVDDLGETDRGTDGFGSTDFVQQGISMPSGIEGETGI
jgi:dUTP pyrophosphatase